MPLLEVLPNLYLRTGLTPDSELPPGCARLEIHEGTTPPGEGVLHLRLPDEKAWPPQVVRQVVAFVTQHLGQGKPVVVGCVSGVSRSPSAIIAYLVAQEGLTTQAALERLLHVHPVARPARIILDSIRACFGR